MLDVVVMGIQCSLDVDFAFPAEEFAGFVVEWLDIRDGDEFVADSTPNVLRTYAWKGVRITKELTEKPSRFMSSPYLGIILAAHHDSASPFSKISRQTSST